MQSRIVAIQIFIVSLYIFNISDARVYYVHPDSLQNNIQQALSSSTAKDTVLVAPGTYSENIVWPEDNGIVLISEKGPDSTIIDGGYTDCVIRFLSPSNIKDNSTVIDGFTIRHGDYINGGGINCAVWHSPTIRNNIICENQAQFGAGIYSDGGIDERFGGPLVVDNRIINNQAMYAGGGICCVYESCPTIRDNIIENNTAQYGGGVCQFSYSHAYLVNNTICNNNATYGGGIYCRWRSNTIIDSCTISGNNYAGIYFEDMDDGIPSVRFNDITGNTGYGVYSYGSSQPIEAVNNWWGNANGPYHPVTNPNGLGDTVSDNVDYAPWLQTCTHCLAIMEYGQDKQFLIDVEIKPNPFTNFADIRYQITDDRTNNMGEKCNIRIYDVNGRLVKDVDLSPVTGHQSSVKWYGDDDTGRELPAGIYLLKFEGEGYCANRKIVIVR